MIEVKLTEAVVSKNSVDALEANMPCRVVNVLASPGNRIAASSVAVELSYGRRGRGNMKVFCPSTGRVERVLVSQGDIVETGRTLFTLEADSERGGGETTRTEDRLSSLALTATGECAACFTVVPIPSFSREAKCPGCDSTFSLGALWPPVFTGVRDDAYAIARGVRPIGEPHQLDKPPNGLSKLDWGVCAQLPVCGCGRALPLEMLADAKGVVICADCGKELPLRTLKPGQEWLVGTMKHEVLCFIELPQVTSPRRSEAVDVKCSNCGAELRVDGSSRTVHCQFCNGTQVLAADAWSRIRPVAKVQPIFFLFRPDPGVLKRLAEAEPSSASAPSKRNIFWDNLPTLVISGVVFYGLFKMIVIVVEIVRISRGH